MKKEKTIIIRLDSELQEKYKKLCNVSGHNMSQKIRNFIENEIEKTNNLISRKKELDSELEKYIKNNIMKGYSEPFIYGGIVDYFPPFMYDIILIDNNGNRIIGHFDTTNEFTLGIHHIGLKYNIHIRYPRI